MTTCRYCGATFTGNQAQVACPVCWQKTPEKSFIDQSFKGLQQGASKVATAKSVAAPANPAIQNRGSASPSQIQRTPEQLKEEYRRRLAASVASNRPKLFSPLRFIFALMMVPVWLFAILPVAQSFKTPNHEVPDMGLSSGIATAVAALVLSRVAGRGVVRSALATLIYGVSALLVFFKPFVAPILWSWDGETHPFSPTSETHLYFLIPGAILILFTFIRLMSIFGDLKRLFQRTN